ncbi:hypothetical protein B0H14DRAFT_3486196 [Mycena olivaceomarginata]|nr:hypothetical protein B0H14DRAFT_3486196 [Mycena olivaceomarginata]
MPPPELKLLRLCSSPSLGADYGLPQSRPGPWLHSGDLEYLPGHLSIETWSDFRIVSFLEEHVISIPPYRDGRSDPLVVISSSGETTIVPMGYRVPLLWLAKVQWESLKIAVTVHCSLWDIIKLDLVYISRLTATFLAHAREAGVRAASGQIDKRWRDPMFDRVMTRFFVGWMGCRDVFVEEFYKEFKDEEYKEDVVRRRWAQKVVCPGIGGFTLTTRELKDGGDAHEFLSGLTLDRDNLTFHFAPEPQSPSAMSSPLSSLESDEEEGI